MRRHNLSDQHLMCAVCGEQNPMISIEQSGLVCGIDVRAVFHLLGTGEVHFAELPSGLLLICVASLQAEMRKAKQ